MQQQQQQHHRATMDSTQTQRSPAAQVSSQPPTQVVYISADGRPITSSHFEHIMRETSLAMERGEPVSQSIMHELMWMLSQHQPNHHWLKGRPVMPPMGTSERALQHLGIRVQDQHVGGVAQTGARMGIAYGGEPGRGQSQGPGSPQWPIYAPTAPNMIPITGGQAQKGGSRGASAPGLPQGQGQLHKLGSPRWPTFAPTAPNMHPANVGLVQQGGPQHRLDSGAAQLDPRLADASAIPGYPTPSPSHGSPNVLPSASMTMPRGTVSHSPASISNYPRSLATASTSPQAGLCSLPGGKLGPGTRASAAPSPYQNMMSPQPVCHNTDRTQAAHPAPLVRRPSYTSAPPEISDPAGSSTIAVNGLQTSAAPRMGMFQPPSSRPMSAHGAIAPTQQKNMARKRPSKEGRMNSEASRRGASHMDMSAHKFNLDSMTPEQRQRFEEMRTATLGTWDTKEERHQAMMQLHKAQAVNRQSAGAMSPPPQKITASTPAQLPRQSKKRKDAPTPAVPPKKKHQVIDLTNSNPSRQPHPSSHNNGQEPNHGFGPNTTILPSALRQPPPHRHVAAPDLYAHAVEHGIHVSDVEFNGNIRKMQKAWLLNEDAISRARSLLDPPAEKVQRLLQRNTAPQQSAVYVAEPLTAAAKKKVRSTGYDYRWSRGDGAALTLTTDADLSECVREADGGLRAPEEGVRSEQTADLLFALDELTRAE